MMSTIAEQLQEAADKATQASEQAGLWATGPDNTTVPTDSGPVPTIAEFNRAAQARVDTSIEAIGWVLAGDFTAGCTVTDRNQYVLVVGGAGYRWDGVLPKVVAPGSSPTPIATGSWVLVGDMSLRSDLAAPSGGTLVKLADGETAQQSIDNLKLNKTNIILESYSATVPTQHATLQGAVDHISLSHHSVGVVASVVIESGHKPSSGIVVENGDYGHILITSQDAEIELSASFPAGGYFINANNSIAPVLGKIVNGAGVAGRAYSIFGSIGKILPGAGGRNLIGRAWYANASILQAGLTEWYNIGDQMYASAGSAVQFGGSLVDGSTVTSNGAVTSSRGSTIEAQGLIMRNCSRGLECKRASSGINAHGATFENISGFIARASRGASISINGSTATDVVGAGIEAFGGTVSASEGASITAKVGNSSTGITASGGGNVDFTGSSISDFGVDNVEARDTGRVSAASASVTGAGRHNLYGNQGGHIAAHGIVSTGAAVDDARVFDGGIIEIRGGTTSNSVSAGAPNVVDTNVNGFGGFNVIATGSRGIIWG